MLFKQHFLAGLAAGRYDLAFRRWDRPRVRPGTQLRTGVGVVAVDTVAVVAPEAITDAEALRAGHAARAELIEALADYGGGDVYRVALRLAGADPRVALRESTADLPAVAQRLQRLDAASPHGPWTTAVLRLIADRPGVAAAELAATLGRDKLAFKRDVRKLKELGLTESLEQGYRLSPRGRAYLGA